MAENSTVLTVQVNGANVEIDSLAKAKKAIKDLNAEVLKGNKEALKSLADVKDRLEDVREATDTVKGSGVEKLTSSFGLLKQGFTSFDTDKIATGFKGIGTAMAAIPLLLLVEGVVYLIENFDELSKGNGVLAKTLRSVGDAVSSVINFFGDLIGVTSKATRAIEDQGEAMDTASKKTLESLSLQTAAYDRQVAVAKAAGQSTIDIEKAKQENIIKTNLEIAKQIEAYVRSGGEFTEERQKQLSASLEAIKAARTAERVSELENQNKARQDYTKHLEDLRKIKADSDKMVQDAVDKVESERIKRAVQENNDEIKAAQDRLTQKAKDDADLLKLEEETTASFVKVVQSGNEQQAKSEGDLNARKRKEQENYFNAAKGLSDAFFNGQLNLAKGNQQKTNEILKKQFQVDKAFNLARAVIEGVRAVQANLAFPPLALSVGILAAANVAKIASVQFQGSTDSGGSSAPAISGNAPAPAPPQIASNAVGSTIINNNGQSGDIQAYVVETQARSVSDRVRRLTEQSQFG